MGPAIDTRTCGVSHVPVTEPPPRPPPPHTPLPRDWPQSLTGGGGQGDKKGGVIVVALAKCLAKANRM